MPPGRGVPGRSSWKQAHGQTQDPGNVSVLPEQAGEGGFCLHSRIRRKKWMAGRNNPQGTNSSALVNQLIKKYGARAVTHPCVVWRRRRRVCSLTALWHLQKCVWQSFDRVWQGQLPGGRRAPHCIVSMRNRTSHDDPDLKADYM